MSGAIYRLPEGGVLYITAGRGDFNASRIFPQFVSDVSLLSVYLELQVIFERWLKVVDTRFVNFILVIELIVYLYSVSTIKLIFLIGFERWKYIFGSIFLYLYSFIFLYFCISIIIVVIFVSISKFIFMYLYIIQRKI